MGSRLSISGSKCVAARRTATAPRAPSPPPRRTASISPPARRRSPATPRRWVASSATVDGVSLFDVKGGVKLMEGAQSPLPRQRALPAAPEAVLQLGQLRLKLLPDLTRTRPAPPAKQKRGAVRSSRVSRSRR